MPCGILKLVLWSCIILTLHRSKLFLNLAGQYRFGPSLFIHGEFALINHPCISLFVKLGILCPQLPSEFRHYQQIFLFAWNNSRKLKAHITLHMKMSISVIRNTSIVTLNEGHILTRRFIMRVTSTHAAET